MKNKFCAAFILLFMQLILSQPATAEPNSPNITPSAQVLGITLGLYQPPTVNYGNELNAVNALTNKVHGIVMYYLNWATAFDPFLQNQINSQMSAGNRPIIMLAWGPAEG